jgi:hypothetical protein
MQNTTHTKLIITADGAGMQASLPHSAAACSIQLQSSIAAAQHGPASADLLLFSKVHVLLDYDVAAAELMISQEVTAHER